MIIKLLLPLGLSLGTFEKMCPRLDPVIKFNDFYETER